jgi:hypothetical protein
MVLRVSCYHKLCPKILQVTENFRRKLNSDVNYNL